MHWKAEVGKAFALLAIPITNRSCGVKGVFIGVDRERLLERGSFFTRYASEIESDPVGDYTRTRQALEELGIDPEEVTDDDCSALR